MPDQFEERARGWDETPWKIKLAQETYDAICSKVDIHPDARLIDFGGGTGLMTLKFKSRVSKITIIDTSQAMLAVLRDKIEAQNSVNIEIINQELSTASLPANSCDIIISMMTLHHIENLLALFQLFHYILASNGKIALADLAREDGDFHPREAEYVHDGFEPADLRVPLEDAGFKNIDIEAFTSVTKQTDSGDTKNCPILLVSAVKR